MSETALRKYIGNLIGGHASQIESGATSAGIPDTSYCIDGVEGWAELKWAKQGQKFKLRKTQLSWMRDRINAGAERVFIIWRYETPTGKSHGIIRVSKHNLEHVFLNTYPTDWHVDSCAVWGEHISADHLISILRRKQ